jgi:hypothetical protein
MDNKNDHRGGGHDPQILVGVVRLEMNLVAGKIAFFKDY